MQDEICIVTFRDKLRLAPPCNDDPKVNQILEIDAGTGLWAIDYADQHSEAELYLRPVAYIQLRFTSGSLANWKELVTKAYDNLVPGGYFEIQDINDFTFVSDDSRLTSEHPLAEFGKLIREAMEKFRRSFLPGPELKPLLTDVGFEDVT
ncbi:TAM domain methyltransferase [Colletotrichum graminicola]|nr:TAM domain methyltransferase [Colletotrichum graminicola]